MKELQKKLNTMFSDLLFESQRHLYFLDNRSLRSVSKTVETYYPPFDEAKWLPIIARRDRVTEQELKHKWQTINITACDLGHETHDFLEHYNGLQTSSSPQQAAGIKYLKSLQGKYIIVAKELKMYSKRLRYAGTCDLLLYNIITGKFVLADYKTNADIFKTFGMMNEPFEYLESNPYNHYQIQLSLYHLMLKEKGIDIEDRILVYLLANGEYKTYSLYDFTDVLEQDLTSKLMSA